MEDEINVLERELLNLKKTWLKLTKIKDSVIARSLVPGSISFQEYEEYSKKAIAGNVARTRSTERNLELCLHRLCGINFIEEETKKENVCEEDNKHDMWNREVYNVELVFATKCAIYSGYSVKLTRVENEKYKVENYYLPYGIESSLVKDKSFSDFKEIVLFLKILHRCGNALFDRKRQLQEYINFCESNDIDVNVSTSYHRLHTEITLLSDVIMKTMRPNDVTFTLKYNCDSFLPFEVTYQKKDFSDKEKTRLNYCMSELLTTHLIKGFRNMLNNKTFKCEPSDESFVSSEENIVAKTVETRQEEKLTPSRSQSLKEQENKESNVSEEGSSKLNSLIPDMEERVSSKQQKVNSKSKDISSKRTVNSADKQHIPTTKQNDTNDIQLGSMKEQQEDQSDLAITDLSSIVNSDEVLTKDVQHRRTTKTLVSSTPLSHRKSAMTMYGTDDKKKITSNKIHVKRPTGLIDAYHQRNIQEFMKRNENSQKEKSPSICEESKIHKPQADTEEHERLEKLRSLETLVRDSHVSFNAKEKKVPHRDTPLVQSSKRKRIKITGQREK